MAVPASEPTKTTLTQDILWAVGGLVIVIGLACLASRHRSILTPVLVVVGAAFIVTGLVLWRQHAGPGNAPSPMPAASPPSSTHRLQWVDASQPHVRPIGALRTFDADLGPGMPGAMSAPVFVPAPRQSKPKPKPKSRLTPRPPPNTHESAGHDQQSPFQTQDQCLGMYNNGDQQGQQDVTSSPPPPPPVVMAYGYEQAYEQTAAPLQALDPPVPDAVLPGQQFYSPPYNYPTVDSIAEERQRLWNRVQTPESDRATRLATLRELALGLKPPMAFPSAPSSR